MQFAEILSKYNLDVTAPSHEIVTTLLSNIDADSLWTILCLLTGNPDYIKSMDGKESLSTILDGVAKNNIKSLIQVYGRMT